MLKNDEMKKLVKLITSCRKCTLWKNLIHPVVCEGKLETYVLFIGEAPGYHEDIQGRPFVGRAGKIFGDLSTQRDY